MTLDAILADQDTKFVSCNPAAGPVRRFGVSVGVNIACDRDPENPRRFKFRPEEIVVIPGSEFRRFLTEYTRVLREGALKVRTREEYIAWLKKSEELEAKRAEEFKAEAARAEQAVKDAKAKAEPKTEAPEQAEELPPVHTNETASVAVTETPAPVAVSFAPSEATTSPERPRKR